MPPERKRSAGAFPGRPRPGGIPQSRLRAFAKSVVSGDPFPMMATVDRGRPRVRPVRPLRTRGFTLFVASSRYSGKVRQLASNPNVEICFLDGNLHQVRISGKALIVRNRRLLYQLWKSDDRILKILGRPGHPDLIVYRIRPDRVRLLQHWGIRYREVPLATQASLRPVCADSRRVPPASPS